MRIVKLAIISLVVLFLVTYFFSLIIPSTIRVSRAMNIAVSKDSLRAMVTDLRQWHLWNELVENPELTHAQFSQNEFSSDQLQVTSLPSTGDTLKTAWRQQKNAQVLASGFTWEGNDDQLVIQWYFDIKLHWYPWEKFGSIVFDKQMGPPMEKSLGNLKKLLERNP